MFCERWDLVASGEKGKGMIEALVFDFDGVILDTETPLFQAWQEVLQEFGLSLSVRAWAGMVGQSADPQEPYTILERQLDEEVDRDEIYRKRMQREAELLAKENLLPGVASILKAAKARSLKLGIASSSDRNWVTRHLVRLGLYDSFSVIKCAEDVQLTKPHPDLYLAVLEDLHIDARQAIALEDSLNGVIAAKEAGLFCIAIPNRITRNLPMPQADAVLDSLEGISLERLLSLIGD
jgi:HAD superfamily hydrolase (TIGR01509 family)